MDLASVLGPLDKLIQDKNFYEISVDRYDEVFCHSGNGVWQEETLFKNEEEYLKVIGALKEHLDVKEGVSQVARYLRNDLSVTMTLEPVSIKGPSLQFLKLSTSTPTWDDYISWGALDDEGKLILERELSVGGILCAGDFGCGKTTLYNLILNNLPEQKKLVSIEREPSLIINRKRASRLMPRELTDESMLETIDMAERLYGDYVGLTYLSGKVVGPFLEMMRNNADAISVVGGKTPEDALTRLQTMTVVSSQGLTLEEAATLISDVFQTLVFQEKRGGQRLISRICKIKSESGELKLENIYQR